MGVTKEDSLFPSFFSREQHWLSSQRQKESLPRNTAYPFPFSLIHLFSCRMFSFVSLTRVSGSLRLLHKESFRSYLSLMCSLRCVRRTWRWWCTYCLGSKFLVVSKMDSFHRKVCRQAMQDERAWRRRVTAGEDGRGNTVGRHQLPLPIILSCTWCTHMTTFLRIIWDSEISRQTCKCRHFTWTVFSCSTYFVHLCLHPFGCMIIHWSLLWRFPWKRVVIKKERQVISTQILLERVQRKWNCCQNKFIGHSFWTFFCSTLLLTCKKCSRGNDWILTQFSRLAFVQTLQFLLKFQLQDLNCS